MTTDTRTADAPITPGSATRQRPHGLAQAADDESPTLDRKRPLPYRPPAVHQRGGALAVQEGPPAEPQHEPLLRVPVGRGAPDVARLEAAVGDAATLPRGLAT